MSKLNSNDFYLRRISMCKTKKIYKTPTIRKVKLVPEEAVLGVCKSDTGAGPNQSTCIIPQCFNPGS